MENFKQIAEDCLAGKLSGVFILRNSGSWKSNTLSRYSIEGKIIPGYYVLGKGIILDSNGLNMETKERVQNFIPNNMQKKIEIDIPEGKIPVMEQTEKGVVITWKEKELTYDEIYSHLHKNKVAINYFVTKGVANNENESFLNKTNILRKLTNIRNYFGKPDSYDRGYCIEYSRHQDCLYVGNVNTIRNWTCDVLFKEKEHAEQAIKMLGDKLKYLFEPW